MITFGITDRTIISFINEQYRKIIIVADSIIKIHKAQETRLHTLQSQKTSERLWINRAGSISGGQTSTTRIELAGRGEINPREPIARFASAALSDARAIGDERPIAAIVTLIAPIFFPFESYLWMRVTIFHSNAGNRRVPCEQFILRRRKRTVR